MQLAPSIHRIGSDLVNVYLVEDETGVTIIDTGLPGHWNELQDELALMGRSGDDIRGVVLTHGDSDHLGFAERARGELGVPVFVHEADADLATGKSKKKNPSWGKFKVGPTLGFLWYAARRGGLRTTPLAEVEKVRGGETLNLPGSPQILSIPGHSPGSIAIFVPLVGAVFVGDALTTRNVLTGVVGPQPAPFTLDEERAAVSLAELESLDATWVLPGHGAPYGGGAAEAVRVIRALET
jgi:glyoxylase-like metal-dependent hydrolase (beta-lactamase superfamily II)